MALNPEVIEYGPRPVDNSAATEMMISRQAQEVQAAMVVAKRFPRDENQAILRIQKACQRMSLAESAMYEFPRGNQKVTGPSIRLAEVLAQNWGNIDSGILELEQKYGESVVMAYAWDLETNTRSSKVFTVKHERHTKTHVSKLTDPRDIYEMVANQGARRLRSCILGVIPGDVVDLAVEQCERTLVGGQKEPFEDRIRKMLIKFDQEYQVTPEMLEKYIGCKTSSFSEQDYLRLGKVYKALKDGMAKRDDYFDVRAGQEAESKTEELFNKAQQGQKPRKQGNRNQGGNKPTEGDDSDGDSSTGNIPVDQSELLLDRSEPTVSE